MGSILAGILVYNPEVPEQGPARVIAVDSDERAELFFIDDAEVRRVPLRSGVYRRLRLPVGVQVKVVEDSGTEVTGEIVDATWAEDASELNHYLVETDHGEHWCDESEVEPIRPESSDPLAQFEALHWRGAYRYFSRRDLQEQVTQWYEDSEGLPALLGSRIRPLAHQIYAVQRVMWNREPRFILADEVGLGKTIEAGLVIQSLLMNAPDMRVLVLAPGSMSKQWFTELYLRFGARAYTHIDAAKVHKSNPSHRATLLKRQRVILSTTALEQFPEIREQLIMQGWDFVVVDEAHKITPDAPIYDVIRRLSAQASGMLALSATPSKREVRGMLGLLALVAPEAYDPDDEAAFRQRLEVQEKVWRRLAHTIRLQREAEREGQTLKVRHLERLAQRWRRVLAGDPIVDELLEKLEGGDVDAINELTAYVQEHYRVDHRIIRTRRAHIRELGESWSKRTSEILDYKPTRNERLLAERLDTLESMDVSDPNQRALRGLYYRLASTSPEMFVQWARQRLKALQSPPIAPEERDLLSVLAGDPSPTEERLLIKQVVEETPPLPDEKAWLRGVLGLAEDWAAEVEGCCARFESAANWIRKHLSDAPDNKVLVFAQSQDVVEEFGKYVQATLKDNVSLFHAGMDDEELADTALAFQTESHHRVLISDELGGEGRNFQIASAVVHLDQPWSVSRVEQRVGRLDRIGRDPNRPVKSVVLSGPVLVEQKLVELNHEVFRVYSRSIGGLEYRLPEIQRQISRAACTGGNAFDSVVEQIGTVVEQELGRVDEAFEAALDSSKQHLEQAKHTAELLDMGDGIEDPSPLRHWAKMLNASLYQVRDSKNWVARWSPAELRRTLKGYRHTDEEEATVSHVGTFSRSRALENESLQFFGPGHRFVDALAHDVMQPNDGRATAFKRELGADHRGSMFVVATYLCVPNKRAWKELDMPAGLLNRCYRRAWPQFADIAYKIDLDAPDAPEKVEDWQLLSELTDTYRGPEADRKLEYHNFIESFDVRRFQQTMRKAVEQSKQALERKRKPLVEDFADRLANDLRHDMGYLRGVITRSADQERIREAQKDLELREQLVEGVRTESRSLDALAIIVGR